MPSAVALGYGLANDGQPVRTAQLAELTGADELWLWEAAEAGMAPALLTTGLLRRMLAGHDADLLSVGDAEILLRAIAADALGPRAALTLSCPAGCGERFDIDVPLNALSAPAPDPPAAAHPAGKALVRVPTLGDLTRVLASANPAVALAQACLVSGDLDRAALAAAIERLDPNAECRLVAPCPSCGAEAHVVIDALRMLLDGLAIDGGIWADIDRLGRAYGWAESDILAIPRRRRRRYCALAEGVPR